MEGDAVPWRSSGSDSDVVKTTFYLITNKAGNVRVTKRAPDLARSEIGIKLEMEVADSAFRSPILEGKLDVGRDEVMNAAPVTFSVGPSRRRMDLSGGVSDETE